MKTIIRTGLFLFIFFLMVTGCSKEGPVEDSDPTKQETFTKVSFAFTGEVLTIYESPLTRSTEAKDWYAFQVYSRPEGTDDSYGYYAYGFFDNIQDMVINLKDGYEYKFDVYMLPEGSEKVGLFALVNAGWKSVDNTFHISSTESVRYMYTGYLYMIYPSSDQFDRPMVDRFFGKIEGYKPTSGGTVSINMLRTAFGAKFVALDFTSGSLEISVEGSANLNLNSADGSEIQEIYSFNYPGQAFDTTIAGGQYSESIPVNIVWVKSDGVRVPVANESVVFKRNTLTTVEFVVQENASSSSFNLTNNEEFESGGKVQIGGDGENTPVNPG